MRSRLCLCEVHNTRAGREGAHPSSRAAEHGGPVQLKGCGVIIRAEPLRRRNLLIAGLAAFGAVALPLRRSFAETGAGEPFDYEILCRRAQELAGQPHNDETVTLPDGLKGLGYDQYRDIRFVPERAIWRGARRFEVQLFHPGFLYDRPVRVSIVSGGEARPVAYRRELFSFGANRVEGDPPSDLGFAGFRLHYPLHRPGPMDEVIAFLGASYFRMLGRDQKYGLSARGLAIDTAQPRGEEFPRFREFWIEEPAADADAITVHALLDSPRCTGAYRFQLRPGTETVAEVHCALYPRADIEKLGLAPLTSMFFYGEGRSRRADDFRPEVHDSDGLQVATGAGEWIWRPLANPRALRVSSFAVENPRGFGLCQRDRRFENYQDLESLFHKRPSLWVEPIGAWGKGRVELVEIPSEEEINDNIVAYWVPEPPVRKGNPLTLSYRLVSFLDLAWLPPLGRVASTRIGSARTPGNAGMPREARHFVVDFDGGELPHLDAEEVVDADVSASTGKLLAPVVLKNAETGGWRVFFDFAPDGKPSDLRCRLRLRGAPLTETWTYLWTPA
ncbi:glucan biosynthesis protein [Azospirillum baldaniorum]|uniref:glucan biosynthesis protein n=1 Tax=Azospirillum baldaniorum TaxID=1064539 RepID=UPI0011A964F0|nr:glucan biosynthesis protein G [Azospirillum baldaniorum]